MSGSSGKSSGHPENGLERVILYSLFEVSAVTGIVIIAGADAGSC